MRPATESKDPVGTTLVRALGGVRRAREEKVRALGVSCPGPSNQLMMTGTFLIGGSAAAGIGTLTVSTPLS